MRNAVVILTLLVCTAGFGQVVDSKSPTISVSGDAEVKVVPDEVVLNVGVQTFEKTLAAAKQANDAAMTRTIAKAREFGIPSEKLQTDYISIDPQYRDNDHVLTLQGYIVRKSLSITMRDLSKFEALLSALLDSGANVVHGIEFRTTELRRYRDQARAMAMKAAKEKAEALAATHGLHAGKAITISEGGGGWWSGYSWWGSRYSYAYQNVSQNWGGSSGAPEGSIAPGQITVSAHVSVSYALE